MREPQNAIVGRARLLPSRKTHSWVGRGFLLEPQNGIRLSAGASPIPSAPRNCTTNSDVRTPRRSEIKSNRLGLRSPTVSKRRCLIANAHQIVGQSLEPIRDIHRWRQLVGLPSAAVEL